MDGRLYLVIRRKHLEWKQYPGGELNAYISWKGQSTEDTFEGGVDKHCFPFILLYFPFTVDNEDSVFLK